MTRGGPAVEELEADLVVLSHLRWDWVWQRPQHLISRIGAGRPTLFVEEPRVGDVDRPTLRTLDAGVVCRAWLELPPTADNQTPEWADVDPDDCVPAITELLESPTCDVWLYAPTAVAVAEALCPRLIVYDLMDDLRAFADATPELAPLMSRALAVADIVFAGGRSLQRTAASLRADHEVHLFPSGVEMSHYAEARELRHMHARRRPVAGYVGVLDERLDLRLLRDLARELSDWEIALVGPTAKIDPRSIPTAPNIHRLGHQPYERLPALMASFDVALMPFALNDATRSISPTKTLEYLAAGLPVVSTRVPDVVSDWSGVVRFADDGPSFAAACRDARGNPLAQRELDALAERYEWNRIAMRMAEILQRSARAPRPLAA